MGIYKTLRAYGYELIAFWVSAAVMALEIVGTRLISPYFGTSTYVWTAMIGVVLGALAAGYAIGGRMADKRPGREGLSFILIAAALTVLLLGLTQQPLLELLGRTGLELRLNVLLAATILFGPPGLLLGMVAPHLAKLRITSLATTGATVGRLEAAGALGSIAGTFLCGYILLDWFGSRSIVIGVAVLLLLLSLALARRVWQRMRLVTLAASLVALPLANARSHEAVLADVDSGYSRYQVGRTYHVNREVIALSNGGGALQSAVALDDDELVFGYTNRLYEAAQLYGRPARTLTIGGGALTLPSALVRDIPGLRADVAEIDPKLTELAGQFFRYRPSPRLNVIAEDGRSYLNRNTERYDMIFMDAYSGAAPPFHLTTVEATRRLRQSLKPEGVVVANVIARYDSTAGTSPYLQALQATDRQTFRHVAVYPVFAQDIKDDQRQGFIVLATDRPDKFEAIARGIGPTPLRLATGGLVLTDDHAPIDRLVR